MVHLFSFSCIHNQLAIYLSSIFQHQKKIYLKCGNTKLIVLIIHGLSSWFLLIYNESSFLLLCIHIYLDILNQLKNVNFMKNKKFHFKFLKCFSNIWFSWILFFSLNEKSSNEILNQNYINIYLMEAEKRIKISQRINLYWKTIYKIKMLLLSMTSLFASYEIFSFELKFNTCDEKYSRKSLRVV
jgi:hypothetical protein